MVKELLKSVREYRKDSILTPIFVALSGKYSAQASAGFAKNLRKDMYYRVQGYSFSNIDRFSTASIVTRLTTDVTNIQNAYQMIIRMAVRGPLMIVFSMVMAFSINGDQEIQRHLRHDLQRLFQSGKAAGFQLPADAVLLLRGHASHRLVRRPPHRPVGK